MPKKPPTAKPPAMIEHKTTWATWAAGIYSAAVAYLLANPDALDWAPTWAKSLVAFIVGTGIVRGAAYSAPHTDRPDVVPPPPKFGSVAPPSEPIQLMAASPEPDAPTIDHPGCGGEVNP